MKKFFIVLCGILIIGDAFGAKRTLNTPTLADDVVIDAWGMKDALKKLSQALYDIQVNNKTDALNFYYEFSVGNVRGIFAPTWQFNTKAGTYGKNEEGSITPIIAREIYEHGGKFCMTQMQAAFGSQSGKFIDYFDNDRYKCQTICEPGYYGESCEKIGYECPKSGEDVDYTKDLNNREDGDLRLLDGKENNRIRPQVFGYKNGGYSLPQSDVMVLGLLNIKKHSVVASPVYVHAYNDVIESATSAKPYQKLLCAPGYTRNDLKNDCEFAPQCGNMNYDFCLNETGTGFDEASHVWIIDSTRNCKYFRCRDNYGFRSETDKTCVECSGGALAYVNSEGLCATCKIGEIVNDTKTGCSPNVQSFNKSEMHRKGNKECWMEIDEQKFAGCVHGCPKKTSDGACWDKTSKTCKTCD